MRRRKNYDHCHDFLVPFLHEIVPAQVSGIVYVFYDRCIFYLRFAPTRGPHDELQG